jgi:hypothetical protein
MITVTSACIACAVCLAVGALLGICWAVLTAPGYDARKDAHEPPTWKIG